MLVQKKKKGGAVLENSNVLVAVVLAIVITSSIIIFSGLDTTERAKLANFGLYQTFVPIVPYFPIVL